MGQLTSSYLELWIYLKEQRVEPHCMTCWENLKKSPNIRKIIVCLFKSGSSLGTIFRFLKVPRSCVQTIMHSKKFQHDLSTQPLYRSGVNMLGWETRKRLWLSTVKWVLVLMWTERPDGETTSLTKTKKEKREEKKESQITVCSCISKIEIL